jgi:uncharacterized protein
VLEKEINLSLKNAMKQKDQVSLSVLRMMISDIKNYKIANLVKGDISDADVISVLQKMAKKYRESIESFEKGGRRDLVEKETAELGVLSDFLPQDLTNEEVEGLVQKAIGETGASSAADLAVVMKTVMPLVKGRADGKLVNEMVRKKLGAA